MAVVGVIEAVLFGVTVSKATGNSVPVKFLGHGDSHLNLHSVWDENLVETALDNANVNDGAMRLQSDIKPEQRTAWATGKTKDWAMESHDLAVKHAYGEGQDIKASDPPVNLDQAYVEHTSPVVKEQLQKAGVRLANLLNDAFKD